MAYFSAIAIFLGAFLLFLVQPILGKMILPWFGGTPAVWTTCMLFFQVLLLGGYAYAAVLTRTLRPRGQALVHAGLLIVTLSLLPITPSEFWKPTDGGQPAGRILLMLLACVGFPYFLLSATSPLVQTWFAHANPGRSPYRLYALSNVGSLGALLVYPLAIEPQIGTTQQGVYWSVGFAIFVLVAAAMAWQLRTMTQPSAPPAQSNSNVASSELVKVSWWDRAIWLGLPALASMMLLAVTNHLCQDVAVVPFLWIAPLSLYLISLIICFDRDQWYKSYLFALLAIFVILFACDMAFMAYVYQNTSEQPRWVRLMKYDIRLLVSVYLSLFFFGCMLCHGEVVRRRPKPEKLTEFYLTNSAGGALGGVIVALICPLVFTTFAELKIGIVLTFSLAICVLLRDLQVFRRPTESTNRTGNHPPKKRSKSKAHTRSAAAAPASATTSTPPGKPPFALSTNLRYLVAMLGLVLVGVVASAQALVYNASHSDGPKIQLRNFYGSLTVRDWYPDEEPLHGRALYHGTILHGYQFLTPGKELTPTTYYTESSGVGLTLRAIRKETPIKVGAVGLGIGTVAAYGQHGDIYRFYEINPQIISLAKSNFDFLNKCPAEIQVVPGDARLSLEREEPQGFDALILDAFSGDSIPVHLLTREAIADYWRQLKPSGALIVHISNRYVNLEPIVNRLALEFNLHVAHIRSEDAEGLHISSSEWMVLVKDEQLLNHPSLVNFKIDPNRDSRFSLWTDDYNNLIQVLRTP